MDNIILVDKGDEQKVIAEEKEEWVYQVLLALGVAEEILVDLNNDDIVSYLTSIKVEIFDNCDGTIDIMREGKVVAQWKVPELILVKEGPRKYYYEIHINEWALPFQMSKREKR
jgi:hypothetical protein